MRRPSFALPAVSGRQETLFWFYDHACLPPRSDAFRGPFVELLRLVQATVSRFPCFASKRVVCRYRSARGGCIEHDLVCPCPTGPFIILVLQTRWCLPGWDGQPSSPRHDWTRWDITIENYTLLIMYYGRSSQRRTGGTPSGPTTRQLCG